MLRTTTGRMIFVIYLVISLCLFKYTTGFTNTECETNGNAYLKLEVAEEMIKSAKEKLSSYEHTTIKYIQASEPLDCEDLLKNGETTSGVYKVWPKNRIIPGSISVYCDMETDGGGWTVIQRRGNFSRDKEYFNQDWQAYKEGFGNLKEDFWLGNDNIYALTNQKLYSARFDLGDAEGSKRYAKYATFWIDNEENEYTLNYTGYSGDAGDALAFHNGQKFSTEDRDNDKSNSHCAQTFKAGWWFNACHHSNLNGDYHVGKLSGTALQGHGLIWNVWKGNSESLATTEIKIRRSPR